MHPKCVGLLPLQTDTPPELAELAELAQRCSLISAHLRKTAQSLNQVAIAKSLQ